MARFVVYEQIDFFFFSEVVTQEIPENPHSRDRWQRAAALHMPLLQ